MRTVQVGATDKSVYLRALDSTDFSPETGIAYNTAGLDLWYRRDGVAKTSLTEVTLASLTTGHTDGGLIHVGDGYFRLDLPDACWYAGSETVLIGGTATGMVIVGCEVQLKYEVQPLRVGTATGGGASTCTLDASASAGTDFYVGHILQLVNGTGTGQARIITAYNGSTKVATVDTAWATNPAAGTVFHILPLGLTSMTDANVAAAVLNAVASSYNTALSIGAKINAAGAAATPPTASENAAAVWAATAATGVSASDVLRLVLAILAGKSDISGSTYTWRNKEDSKNAVTATVVAGERTAVTLNLTQ